MTSLPTRSGLMKKEFLGTMGIILRNKQTNMDRCIGVSMQYVYMIIGGCFGLETLVLFIMCKVAKKRKETISGLKQEVETWKAMYDKLESDVKKQTEVLIKINEVKHEKVDVNNMSNDDITNVLSGKL